MVFNEKKAVAAFVKRKKANLSKQVSNSSLYAGAPMYFYCRYCGIQTDVLPESYTSVPRTICAPCIELESKGLIP